MGKVSRWEVQASPGSGDGEEGRGWSPWGVGRGRSLPTPIVPRPNWWRPPEPGSSGHTWAPGALPLRWHTAGRAASAGTRGRGHRGCRWGCCGPVRGCGGAALGPGLRAPRLPWQRRGVSTSQGERGACPPALERGPPSPVLVAFPAPSSGAFFLGPGVQTLRKPLLFLLLTAGALSCPPGPAVSAP